MLWWTIFFLFVTASEFISCSALVNLFKENMYETSSFIEPWLKESWGGRASFTRCTFCIYNLESFPAQNCLNICYFAFNFLFSCRKCMTILYANTWWIYNKFPFPTWMVRTFLPVSLQITNDVCFGKVFQPLSSTYLLVLIWSLLTVSAIRICLLNVNKSIILILGQTSHTLPVYVFHFTCDV